MNRFTWLMAAFYVVSSSGDFYSVYHSTSNIILLTDKHLAEDMAEALNQAHERNRPPKKEIGFNPDDMVHPDREVIPPCLGAVCGEDDFVGKKPMP